VAVVAVLAAAAAFLYAFPPGKYHFYPRCQFHLLTGLHCPGCGATRCLHALLHGDLEQAAAYNLLFVIVLPILIVWWVRVGYAMLTGRKPPTWHMPRWCLWGLVVVVVTFAVLRNVDAYPFLLLAPHEL
jgi:hypothetical protein